MFTNSPIPGFPVKLFATRLTTTVNKFKFDVTFVHIYSHTLESRGVWHISLNILEPCGISQIST